MHNSHKKYLRFIFENKTYQFTCLPFGLSSAPFVFTKILKPAISKLRSLGILLVIYLDDILIFGHNYLECLKNLNLAISLLKKLGFIINYKKSQLIPKQTCTFLGFTYDSSKMEIKLPIEKKKKLIDQLDFFKTREKYKIREFPKLIGTLISCCPAVSYSWLYTKESERLKYLALNQQNENYEGKLIISNEVSTELNWRKNNIIKSYNPIRKQKLDFEIFTDASLSGWGVYCNKESTHGFWTSEEKKYFINYLELLAAYFGLKCYANELYNCQILLRIDNTTAISYLNRMGGVRYKHLNSFTKKVWQWCEKRKIWFFASYIASGKNYKADSQSRRLKSNTEYELSDNNYAKIINKFGKPKIDLFASRENAK